MAKYKVLKTKYSALDGIPESIRNNFWVTKVDDNDRMEIFDFYAEAKDFVDNLKTTKPERNYKIVESNNMVDVETVYEETLTALQEQTALLGRMVKLIDPSSR